MQESGAPILAQVGEGGSPPDIEPLLPLSSKKSIASFSEAAYDTCSATKREAKNDPCHPPLRAALRRRRDRRPGRPDAARRPADRAVSGPRAQPPYPLAFSRRTFARRRSIAVARTRAADPPRVPPLRLRLRVDRSRRRLRRRGRFGRSRSACDLAADRRGAAVIPRTPHAGSGR